MCMRMMHAMFLRFLDSVDTRENKVTYLDTNL